MLRFWSMDLSIKKLEFDRNDLLPDPIDDNLAKHTLEASTSGDQSTKVFKIDPIVKQICFQRPARTYSPDDLTTMFLQSLVLPSGMVQSLPIGISGYFILHNSSLEEIKTLLEESHTLSEAAKSHSCDKTEIISLGEDETDDAHFDAIDAAPINEVVGSTNWDQGIYFSRSRK
ncbi:hypothetical protein VNO80_25597 [Phaseolus coccineus]|uniref:Uncharacterized protein n=1 Tax=Phaseolus coccineus TaxID=3886 RepID=A0AAN9LVK7_PHACN